MPASDHVGAVILGAGFSRRFGADKRLQPLHNSTVAEVTVTTYLQAFSQVRVVVREEDDILAGKLSAAGAEIIVSPQAHLGMGHSLASGFAQLDWQWAFAGLLDMPFVRRETLAKLINIARETPQPAIIRPRLSAAGRDGIPYGHPIGWHARYFDDIRACQGDSGARELLDRYREDVIEVMLEDPGILQDIDTPQDLSSAANALRGSSIL